MDEIISNVFRGFVQWIGTWDWGSVPDWLGALGTIMAVFVAVYLPYKAAKPKGKAELSFLYYTPQFELMGFDISFYNAGNTAINVSSLTLGIVGTNKNLLFSVDFKGGIIQPGEGYSSAQNALGVYEALKTTVKKDKVKVYPKVVDSLGNIYKGKKKKIHLTHLDNEVKFQRAKYLKSPGITDIDQHVKKLN